MLKFDEMNAPEDASGLPEVIFHELLNSKPSPEGLHLTEGTRYIVLGLPVRWKARFGQASR
jgi:hypothetical protein